MRTNTGVNTKVQMARSAEGKYPVVGESSIVAPVRTLKHDRQDVYE